MELQLTDLEFTLDDADIELPLYIVRLDPKKVTYDVDRSNLIIAAGADPKDQKITLITGDGKILIFDSKKYYIPSGPAVPANGGKQIFLENVSGRWSSEMPGFFVDSKWIIEKSTNALANATLHVNYPNKLIHQ